jgi:hypothetical protein
MLIDYMLAVLSEFKDGALRIAADTLGVKGKSTGRTMPSVQPLGIIARPRDPDTDANGKPTIGAGLIVLREGGDVWCWPTTDPRAVEKVPPVKPGGFAAYSYPGGCFNFDGDNGAFLLLVPSTHDTDDGTDKKRMSLSFDVAGDSIQCTHGLGMSWAMTGGGKNSVAIANAKGDAYLEVNDDGIVLNGNTTFNGGMAMGDIASAEPVALAPAHLEFLQELITQLATAFTTPAAPGSPIDAAWATVVVPILNAKLAELATKGRSTKLSASP